MTLAIQTQGLGYRAGKQFAIRDLDLHVPAGAIYGFLGPNGSGKTTTIRLLLGLLRPQGGGITLLGEPVPGRLPAILARTGYVPERPHLYPSLTVQEAIAYHRAFYPRWDQRRADDLLAGFLLEPGRQTSRLSKGELGKLMLLLVLAQSPDLLLLDEPTDGLDPVVRREVLTALLDYVSQRGATVFISSHLVHELERICDWVGVMDQGRLVTELPMETFKNGIKRLHVSGVPAEVGATPFALVARQVHDGRHETWIVRGWQGPMRQYIEGLGGTVREVVDLDLEEGFVELLRTARGPAAGRS